MICKVDGCNKSLDGYTRRGMCGPHYNKWRRYGDPTAGKPIHIPAGGPCAVTTCTRPSVTYGMCNAHYRRWLRTGTCDPDRPIKPTRLRKEDTLTNCTTCEDATFLLQADESVENITNRLGFHGTPNKRFHSLKAHLKRHNRNDLADMLTTRNRA